MSLLETILTVAVWALVAVVFFDGRAQAVKQLGEQDRIGKPHPHAR